MSPRGEHAVCNKDGFAAIEADSCLVHQACTGGRKLVAPSRLLCTVENQKTKMRQSTRVGLASVVKSSVKVASSPFSVWESTVSVPSASSSISV